MKAIFCLLFYLLPMPLVFAHEHTNAVPEIDRKFLDTLQRPDNRQNERRDAKSKLCCTDKDAVRVEYKMIIGEGEKYPEAEWYVWLERYEEGPTPTGEYGWVKVPPAKIVEEYSPSGQAYVYLIAHTIQCFVRPQTRY
jgi:hypothetical protein